MNCEQARPQLTAYLDGNLDGDAGTVLRGHLRTCESCRKIAGDEACLRDGLRSLTPVDPPSSLWAGVQARLAAEEVRQSQLPTWRRALTRWWRMVPAPRYVAFGALAVATTIALLAWRLRGPEETTPGNDLANTTGPQHQQFAPEAPKPTPKPAPSMCKDIDETDDHDVTADLARDGARELNAYECAIQDLMTQTAPIRAQWNDRERSRFDENVKTLRAAIASSPDGKPKSRASARLVAYLQKAATRDEVLLAGVQ